MLRQIYVHLEDDPNFGDEVNQVIIRMKQGADTLHTSVFTLGELLLRPIREKNDLMAHHMREILGPPTVELIPLTRPVMDRYAWIRASQSVPPPDAIHLACAAELSIDLFLTNDRKLHKLTIPGIQFIGGIDSGLL